MGAAIIEDKMIVIGGRSNSDDCTDSCELYDVSSNQWTELPCLNQKKSDPSVCKFITDGGRKVVFCFGGIEDKTRDTLTSIEYIDLQYL
jgi:hypothetical protein